MIREEDLLLKPAADARLFGHDGFGSGVSILFADAF